MFSIPHYHVSHPEWCDVKDQILTNLENKLKYSGNTNTTSYFNAEKDKKKSLKQFKEFLSLNFVQKDLAEVSKLGFSNMQGIWYQKYQRGQYHGIHNHGPVGWSGIFYAKFNAQEHSGTEFYAPFSLPTGEMCKTQISVKEGDMIIFPSYLPHQVLPVDSDEERAIIAFNIK